MNERVLHLHVEDESAFLQRATAVLGQAAAGVDIATQDHLSFSDLPTFLSSLSPKRWNVLTTLRALGPSSIRALAGHLGRDYKSVHGDVGKLLQLGIVSRTTTGRVEVPFDRVVADIRLHSGAQAAE